MPSPVSDNSEGRVSGQENRSANAGVSSVIELTGQPYVESAAVSAGLLNQVVPDQKISEPNGGVIASEESVNERLPLLRSELRLVPASYDNNGQPKWTLHDPVKGKYFRIGWLEFELLSRWRINEVDKLIATTNAQTTLRVTRRHVDNLVSMLSANELVLVESNEDIVRLNRNFEARKKSAVKSAFTMSMFYRRALFNPDGLLTAIDRFIGPLYRYKRVIALCWMIASVLAIAGVSAHWFEFKNTFAQFMTVEGFVLFGFVLLLINVLHEMGHGLIAKHYGCRVAEMGAALIFMLPVCYCDTSDAWRLSDQKKRLLISAGGLLMELGVATVACVLWLLLADGIPRTLAFFAAVTSLATTLFINLNPFMKFDGYYLLADYLGVDNLQAKSFSNFNWQLRRWMVGEQQDRPYRVPESSHRALNLYAFCTWLYRLVLYFSICWMVYQFWFKALGLLLMTGVFFAMIVTPVVKESAAYLHSIKKTGLNFSSLLSVSVALLLVLMLCIPLPRNVSAPAVLGSEHASKLYSTSAARIKAVHVSEGDSVTAQQNVLTLEDPELIFERQKLTTEIALYKRKRQLETQWRSGDQLSQVNAFDISAAQAALTEVNQKIGLMELKAADAGVVTSLPAWVKPGLWVKPNTVLVEIASKNDIEVRSYVPAAKRDLLNDQEAVFQSTATGRKINLVVSHVGDSHIETLDDSVLAVPNGGPIAVSHGAVDVSAPLQGWVMALLTPTDSNLVIHAETVGYVTYSASEKSLISSLFDRIYALAIRESGF